MGLSAPPAVISQLKHATFKNFSRPRGGLFTTTERFMGLVHSELQSLDSKLPIMDDLKPARSMKRVLLDLPPSCMQFCPVDSSCFVVGTYNLQREDLPAQKQQVGSETTEDGLQYVESIAQKPQSRNGSLVLFRLLGNDLYVSLQFLKPKQLVDALELLVTQLIYLLTIKPVSRSKQSYSLQQYLTFDFTLSVKRLKASLPLCLVPELWPSIDSIRGVPCPWNISQRADAPTSARKFCSCNAIGIRASRT